MADTLDSTFLISTKNGSTFVSDPPRLRLGDLIDREERRHLQLHVVRALEGGHHVRAERLLPRAGVHRRRHGAPGLRRPRARDGANGRRGAREKLTSGHSSVSHGSSLNSPGHASGRSPHHASAVVSTGRPSRGSTSFSVLPSWVSRSCIVLGPSGTASRRRTRQRSAAGSPWRQSCSGRAERVTGAPASNTRSVRTVTRAPAASSTSVVPCDDSRARPRRRFVVPMKPLTKSVAGWS